MPSMIASVRMSLFAQSHLIPSTKSALKDCRCKRAVVRSSGCILIVATRAAAKANDAALAPNGSPTAATNAQAPSGRPIKLLAITSAVDRRPFAFSSNSVGTIAGRNACADMSKMTSQQPTPSKMNINDQMVSEPCQALKAMIEYSTVRTTFTAIIKCLRLNLSIYTPAGSVSTNQGKPAANETPAISRGSCVRVSASSGAAACSIPSPTLEIEVATN